MELKINHMARHFDEDNLDYYVDESTPYTIIQMGNDKYLVTFDKVEEEPKKKTSEDEIHEYYDKYCTYNVMVDSMLYNITLKLYNAFKNKFDTNYLFDYVSDLFFQTCNTTEKYNKVIDMINYIESETKETTELRMSCYVEESFVCKMLDDIFGTLRRRFQNEFDNNVVEEYPPTFGDYEGKFRAILKMIKMRKTKEPSEVDVRLRSPYSDIDDPLITFLKYLEWLNDGEKQDKNKEYLNHYGTIDSISINKGADNPWSVGGAPNEQDKSEESKEEDNHEDISLLDAIKLVIDDIKPMDDEELAKLFGLPPEFLR